MNTPDREVILARRLYRLPMPYKSVILQLLAKCEDLKTKSHIDRHIINVDSILNSQVTSFGYMKLPAVKTTYYFIDKKTKTKLNLNQVAKIYDRSTKTIYHWVYIKYKRLFNNYEVIKE